MASIVCVGACVWVFVGATICTTPHKHTHTHTRPQDQALQDVDAALRILPKHFGTVCVCACACARYVCMVCEHLLLRSHAPPLLHTTTTTHTPLHTHSHTPPPPRTTAGAWSGRGLIHMRQSKYEEAARSFQNAVDMNPSMAYTTVGDNLAVCRAAGKGSSM